MCCFGSCIKGACKCVKWILIITLIAVLVVAIVVIIVVAVALHGTDTLKKIVEMSMSCISGKDACPQAPGVFYKIVQPFILEDTYEWRCTYDDTTVSGVSTIKAGWGVKFTLGDNDSLGITLTPADGHSESDVLTAYYNFVTPDQTDKSAAEPFNLESSLIEPQRVDIYFVGALRYGAGQSSTNKDACRRWDSGIEHDCRGRLETLSAHFTLKFKNVPDWLCLSFDSDEVGAVKFLEDLAKTLGRVWKDAETAIMSIMTSWFHLPKVTGSGDVTLQGTEEAEYCTFSPEAVKRKTPDLTQ